MMGVPVLFDWGYFANKQQSFPKTLLKEFIQQADLPGVLGNCHASGTEIIQLLGEQHLSSGKPICYTSADSVFQIACHERLFTQQRLQEICLIARNLLDDYKIARVIARPFGGENRDNFQRTNGRRDYSMPPPSATLLDKLSSSGGEVVSIGKIADIFAQQGITRQCNAYGLHDLLDCTIKEIGNCPDNSLIFTNLVDFDTLYGHRRDINGYACALELFDQRLPEIIASLQAQDLLMLTADHGCDPSWPGTDHTREHIPVLTCGYGVTTGSIGKRDSFADIGQTLASLFQLPAMDFGTSFLDVTSKPIIQGQFL
jgi:phosphopentomutase